MRSLAADIRTQRATESLSADRKFWRCRLEDVKLMQMGDSERRGACSCLVSDSEAILFPLLCEDIGSRPEVVMFHRADFLSRADAESN